MNTLQAMKILDQVREGADYSEATITRALFMVGEINEQQYTAMATGMRSQRMDGAVQEKVIGAWPQ